MPDHKRMFNVTILIALMLSLLVALMACSSATVTSKEAKLSEMEAMDDMAMKERGRSVGTFAREEAPRIPAESFEAEKSHKHRSKALYSEDIEPDSTASTMSRSGATPMRAAAPQTSGLKAGYSDDNKQFNYFINFLNKYAPEVKHYTLDVSERITLKVADAHGRTVPNAEVSISARGHVLTHGLTYSDGSYMFFPSEYDKDIDAYTARVSHAQQDKQVKIARSGRREIMISLDAPRSLPQQMPLDIVFVLDTTGSMGEEIARLRDTIEIINLNLSALPSAPVVRFGMVLYKDRGDEYLTRVIPLTGSLEGFRSELRKLRADGGGDEPEDLQAALKDAVDAMHWTPDGLRLAFIITDAPPHLDYGQTYTYINAMAGAREGGIKLFSVGTGGLNLMGEYILRQLAQYTAGKYIFLTYGERGESEGGRPGSVSHHTGVNFATDKLEAIIIQIAKDELRNVTDARDDDSGEYISAAPVEDEKRTETLNKLFTMGVTQLMDYSSATIAPGTPVALFPFGIKEKSLATNAEYFGEQLLLCMSASKSFKVLDRKDIQAAIDEAKFQLSGYVPEDEAVEAGKLTGARLIVVGNMYAGRDSYELFLKLIRVETGEVLSVTKLVIAKPLGLN